MKELISILKESNVSDFVIQEKDTQSQEVFFVEKKLDMGRAKNVTHTTVTVYVDSEDKKFRGSATKEIHPTNGTGQIKVDGEVWSAKSISNDIISEGELITILKIDGVKAVVQKQNENVKL